MRLFALIVDRKTRKVVDVASISYSWDVEGIFNNHDPERIDVIIRQAVETKEPEIPQELPDEEAPPEPPLTQVPHDPAEDIPF